MRTTTTTKTSADRVRRFRETKRQKDPNFSKADAERRKQMRKSQGEVGKKAEAYRQREIRKSRGEIGKKADAERKRRKREEMKRNVSVKKEGICVQAHKDIMLNEEENRENKKQTTIKENLINIIHKNNLTKRDGICRIFKAQTDNLDLKTVVTKIENENKHMKKKNKYNLFEKTTELLYEITNILISWKLQNRVDTLNHDCLKRLSDLCYIYDDLGYDDYVANLTSAKFKTVMFSAIPQYLKTPNNDKFFIPEIADPYNIAYNSQSNEEIDFAEYVIATEGKNKNGFEEFILENNQNNNLKRYLEKEKFLVFSTIPVIDEIVAKFYVKKLNHYKNIKNVYYDNIKGSFEIKFTGSVQALTGKNRIIESNFKNYKINTEFKTMLSCCSNLSNFNSNQLLKVIYSHLLILGQLGCVSIKEAISNLLVRFWHDERDIDLFKELSNKFHNRVKNNKIKDKVSFENAMLFSNEPFQKKCLKDSSENNINIYYSTTVLNYIKEKCFDSLFIDGTHLNIYGKKNQLLIFRIYSSSKNEVVTAAYTFCFTKKTIDYMKIFLELKDVGFFNNIQFVMSDFELAFKSAIKSLNFTHTIVYRFCYTHFLRSLQNQVKSINKAIRLYFNDSIDNNRHLSYNYLSKNIAMFFSALMFVPPENLLHFFYLWFGISNCVFKGVGVILFCDYFYQNYISGHFSNDFYTDLNISRHITNNFVEGVNSGMKKFIKNDFSESKLLKWMLYNTKNTILNLGSNFKPSKLTTDCFVFFQNALIANKYNDALHIICNKIATTGNQSKKSEKSQRITEATFINTFKITKSHNILYLRCSDEHIFIESACFGQVFSDMRSNNQVTDIRKFLQQQRKENK